MVIIPLTQVPAQSFQIILDNQECDILLTTHGDYLYMDLTCNGVMIQAGALVENMTSIIQAPLAPFAGTLSMIDIQGDSNPDYTGLGTRYILTYWSAGEEYAPANLYPQTISV